jgi:hypothetical protein
MAVKTEPIAIPGVAGPVVVATTFWGRFVVTVADQAVPRIGKRQYALPSAVGGTVHATLRSRISDPYPTVEANGVRHRTGPKVPVVLQVLALLPMVLVGIGGALGGLAGALGAIANLGIARTRMPAAAKALVMVAIGAAAVLAYLLVAAAVHAAINQS